MKLYDTGIYLVNGTEIVEEAKASFPYPKKRPQKTPLHTVS